MMATYSDAQIADLYDSLNRWSADNEFYFELAMTAGSLLDVGCGTGMFLNRVREAGHGGRLAGVDSDPSMLAVARGYPGIEWHECRAAAMTFAGEFELVTMMGHAFQALVSDDDISHSLRAIRRALSGGGRFAFETRNPGARAWEQWTPDHAEEVVATWGESVRVSHQVTDVSEGRVSLTETTSSLDGAKTRVDAATLRFVDAEQLARLLVDAGFEIESQSGDWDGSPLSPTSPEIITIARSR